MREKYIMQLLDYAQGSLMSHIYNEAENITDNGEYGFAIYEDNGLKILIQKEPLDYNISLKTILVGDIYIQEAMVYNIDFLASEMCSEIQYIIIGFVREYLSNI